MKADCSSCGEPISEVEQDYNEGTVYKVCRPCYLEEVRRGGDDHD